METYTYNREIRRMILHFMSAIDGAVVKRYDKNQNVLDTIKVDYKYGPKEGIFHDLVDKSGHINLPIVAVTIGGLKRDPTRIKDKLVGRYQDVSGLSKRIPAPIPVNVTFNVEILAKFQSDLEQILTNFIPYSDPYFIIAWKEPFTNSEIRSQVLWSGDIAFEYPESRKGSDQYYKLSAKTSFEFKGFMFKSAAESAGKICYIDTDYILTNDFFCSYDSLVANTKDNQTESFSITGVPLVRSASLNAINTGTYVFDCSGNNPIIRHRTASLTIQGLFPNVTQIFLSASDPNMFVGQSVSSLDPIGTTDHPEFNGIIVQSFVETSKIKLKETPTVSTIRPTLCHTITFDLPPLTGSGYVDIIVANKCGYSKLSEDRFLSPALSCCENPYPAEHPLYSTWNDLQDPFANGIEVFSPNLSCF